MAKDVDGVKNGEIHYIPDRLIADPVVFRGMTDAEVVLISVVSLAFWIPVCVLILSLFGIGTFGLAVGFAAAIGTLLIAGGRLQRLKMKQPDGLHVVHFKRKLQEWGIRRFGFITESQSWDIRRSKPVVKEQRTTDSLED